MTDLLTLDISTQVDEHLISGKDVHIKGNTGSRLGSSMGVDLKYFGGSGQALVAGSIFVDGNVGTRMGISMVSGRIYVSGTVAQPMGNVVEVVPSMVSGRIYVSGSVGQPMGNVVEVVPDQEGYRCFRSITDILHNGLGEDEFTDTGNSFQEGDGEGGVPKGGSQGGCEPEHWHTDAKGHNYCRRRCGYEHWHAAIGRHCLGAGWCGRVCSC